jgi:hypothetical protein
MLKPQRPRETLRFALLRQRQRRHRLHQEAMRLTKSQEGLRKFH